MPRCASGLDPGQGSGTSHLSGHLWLKYYHWGWSPEWVWFFLLMMSWLRVCTCVGNSVPAPPSPQGCICPRVRAGSCGAAQHLVLQSSLQSCSRTLGCDRTLALAPGTLSSPHPPLPCSFGTPGPHPLAQSLACPGGCSPSEQLHACERFPVVLAQGPGSPPPAAAFSCSLLCAAEQLPLCFPVGEVLGWMRLCPHTRVRVWVNEELDVAGTSQAPHRQQQGRCWWLQPRPWESQPHLARTRPTIEAPRLTPPSVP